MRSSYCCSSDAESLSFQGWRAELARGSDSRRLLPLTMDYVSEIVSVREACARCWDIPDLRPWRRVIAGTQLLGALSENRKMHNKTGRFLVWMNAGVTVAVQEIWKSCFLYPWDQTWSARQSRNSSEKEIMLSSLARGWDDSRPPPVSPANRIEVQAVILTIISDANTQICMIRFWR